MAKIKKVRSLFELSSTPELQKLAIVTAQNLGGSVTTFKEAMQVLRDNVMESGDEKGVIDEVNFCRDLV